MKPLIVLTLLAIVASLGKALFSMSSGPEHAARVVHALSWRIGLSVALCRISSDWTHLISSEWDHPISG